MRVIAGSLRGRRLATFEGRDVRPTADRVREALFSILQSRLGSFAGLRVLDLFAGSGALAIEAVSRGATSAVLVEKAPQSAKLIRENIERCHLEDKTSLMVGDAWPLLQGELLSGPFDLVFVDPPYGQGLAERAVSLIGGLSLLDAGGILCAEAGIDELLPEAAGRLLRVDQRRYGSTMLNFYSCACEGCP